MKNTNKKLKKKGSLLLIVSIGIIAIAGVFPFLISDTETSMSVSKSFDETNKQTWALESAVEDKLKESSKNIPELKTQTTNETAEEETVFKYENKAADTDTALPLFESKIAVKEYNTYLKKNSYYQANIKTQDNYNLSQLSAVEVKPGVTIVNNTTYVWDKYGKLYEINNQKKLIPIQIVDNNSKNQAVWQVVSDGLKPIAVIASKSLSVIKIDENNNNTSLGNGYYKFAAKSETFQAGIKQADKANLAIPTKTSISDSFNNTHPNARVEDISVSGNHGLAIVYDKDSAGKDTWQLWGWGNNSNGQVNCLDEDTTSYNDNLVNLSEIYSGNNSSYSSVNLTEYIPLETSTNINAISSFLNNNYKFEKKDDGYYYIKDSVTGEEIKHDVSGDKDNFSCNCPFCQDIANCHQGKPADHIGISFEFSEPQQLKHLEVLVDGSDKSIFADHYNKNRETTELKCTIKNIDNTFSCSVEGGRVNPTNIYEAYGEDIWTVQWDEEHLKNSETNNFYTIPAGKYSVVFEVSYKNNGWKNLKEEGMFWGWIDRPDNVHNIDPSDVYGGIFRLNNNLYNLRDRASEKVNDVNYYAITTGNNFSLALVSPQNWTSESGNPEFSIIGWGDSTQGQLGKGVGSSKEKMKSIDNITSDIAKDYKDMQAGTNHALFLTKSGEVYSWRGNADDINIYKVHKIHFENSPQIVYISAGYNKSAAIDEDGKIYEWSVIEGKEGTVIKPISGTSSRLFSCK